MAQIKPFHGILYNTKKVNIAKAVTPPYDVISGSMQERFYGASPYNIIRLTLGKEKKGDSQTDNKYTRAKTFLNDWLKQKVLLKDNKPSIYVYRQEYLHGGKKRKRLGFIALMKIEDPRKSSILPHEYTLKKPKMDRLRLIRQAEANLSPIFSLFEDNGRAVSKALRNFIKPRKPVLKLEREGVIHSFWRMDDPKAIEGIKNKMREKKIFIADGHHRYEVALNYRNEMRGRKSFKKSMDYVMMYFSSLSEKNNLTILSTHRVLGNIKAFDAEKAERDLKEYFDIHDAGTLENCLKAVEGSPAKKHRFGMYTGKNNFKVLTLKRRLSVEKLIKSGKTKSLKNLDVTILHDIIINKILGVKTCENSIKYVRSEKDAVEAVDKGGCQAAFLLRPTDVMDMKKIAEKGEMMPQKSTYFYPKVLTGLVLNKF